MTTTASSRAAAAQPPRLLLGYYPEWKSAAFPVSKIPADKVSHILYAFGLLNDQGECMPMSASDAASNLKEFAKLKAAYPHLKVLISLGGWSGSAHFSDAVRTPDSRQKLVQSCLDLWILGKGAVGVPGVIDGIDIDWEYPGAPGETNNYRAEDKQNYVLMMAEFRKQLDALGKADSKHYSLSAAIGISPAVMQAGLDFPKLADLLDFLNLMTYDFHGAGEPNGPTDFHNNLFAAREDPGSQTASIESAVKRTIAAGMPADKIVVGVPFYGRGWKNVDSLNHGLFQKASGTLEATYREIKTLYEPTYTKYRHDEARIPWLYNPDTKIFIAYDDPISAGEKADFVVSKGLAGAMFWELTQDDDEFSLTTALCQHLGRAGC